MLSTSRAKAAMWQECMIWQGPPLIQNADILIIQPRNFAQLRQMTQAVLAERRTSRIDFIQNVNGRGGRRQRRISVNFG